MEGLGVTRAEDAFGPTVTRELMAGDLLRFREV
jgi:hypothetical protein